MSKTIPIWTCVINRALADLRGSQGPPALKSGRQGRPQEVCPMGSSSTHVTGGSIVSNGGSQDWDVSLHLPLWVSETERNNIESLLDNWVWSLKTVGADLSSLKTTLKKPLRPLWVSQKTVVWLNEVPDVNSWTFTPVILVSASLPSVSPQRMSDAEFSWSYIPGAADDEESWAGGLTPSLFWKYSFELVSSGPGACNRKVADIVERDRIYRSVRGQDAPQVRVKSGHKVPAFAVDGGSQCRDSHLVGPNEHRSQIEAAARHGGNWNPIHSPEMLTDVEDDNQQETSRDDSPTTFRHPTVQEPPENVTGVHWIGKTGLVVGNSECEQADGVSKLVDCVISCGVPCCLASTDTKDSYLHLPIVSSKFDRHSLQSHLPAAVDFAKKKLEKGHSLLICCSDGEDISVCVCLAILLSCFDSRGDFCSNSVSMSSISKSDVRRGLVYLSGFHSEARPSRGSLKQVYNFLLNNA